LQRKSKADIANYSLLLPKCDKRRDPSSQLRYQLALEQNPIGPIAIRDAS
jgi:hypothetical protein